MKKTLALLLALTMIFALCACGQQAAPAASTGDTVSTVDQLVEQGAEEVTNEVVEQAGDYIKDKIVVSVNPVTSLTPWGTANSTPGNYEVYEMLYECDAKGAIYPLLADANYEGTFNYAGELLPGCDHEAGSEIYDVHIYDCIYDHLGNHITASDIAFCYTWQKDNEAVSGWNDIVSVEALDDTTVRFTFTQEQNTIGGLTDIFCRCFICSEKVFTESASQLVDEMVGTGPYKFVNYVNGSELTIERFDDYWQLKAGMTPRQEQQANVKTIVMKFISESAQKVIGLQTGDLDCVPEIATEDAKNFADGGAYGDKYNLGFYQSKFVNYFNCNCDPASIMSDINMRLAVYNAVDQDGLILATGGNDARLYAYACDYYNDYSYVDWASLDNYNTKTAVDPELVKSYLDAAGYNGEKLVLITSGAADQATVVAAQLAACGINCEVKALDFTSGRTVSADPTQWDMQIDMMAGDNLPVVWEHGFGTANNGGPGGPGGGPGGPGGPGGGPGGPDGGGDAAPAAEAAAEENADPHTSNFIRDPEWEEMLALCNTMDGHTPENMLAWWQHAVDNAYTMGLWAGKQFMVLPEDMLSICQGDKLTFLPGACTYAAP